MKSKLGIDFDKVGHAREMARKIADQVQDFVDGYTTVAVERTLFRLLGIDGVDVHAVPLPNILVDELKEGPLDEYLKAMLDHFFITHDSIKENLQQLSNAASESDKQERVKVKGFAAYKDNSTPLPVDDKQ